MVAFAICLYNLLILSGHGKSFWKDVIEYSQPLELSVTQDLDTWRLYVTTFLNSYPIHAI